LRTVLITGAAAGVGRAAAQLFATEGWRCVLVDRDARGLAAVQRDLSLHEGGSDHITVQADLTAEPLRLDLPAGLGAISALVNNAGMSDSGGEPLTDKPLAALRPLVSLNLQAPLRLLAALDGRLAPGARVVNVASGAGLRVIPFRGAYSASKAGLIAASRALARTRRDLCVTVLCPGFVRTELVQGLIAAGRLDPARAVAKIPLGRMASPEEMAQALLFLCGPGAEAVNGAVLRVDGGSSVYGGSIEFAPNLHDPLPLDAGSTVTLMGDTAEGALAKLELGTAGPYSAVIDASPLSCAPGTILACVHAAARRFAERHEAQASLTLLLPVVAEDDPESQGMAEAARMLVRSLACELGARALRVNAVELAEISALGRLAPLLAYVSGAGAQFMTGEVFSPERSVPA
jgi:NAD(P)-dependent dehydrogenase (short-subunit alcohol dehydrogenase family)